MTMLTDGYSDVSPGKVATVVTCLEMLERVPLRAERDAASWRLRRVQRPEAAWYRALYAHVGVDWLWFSRLAMPVPELERIITHADVEIYALEEAGRDEGLLELDFRGPGECELAFYAVSGALLGRGAGRWLMNRAIERAWARPIRRFWVHTCTFDHPGALDFYLRSGFKPYARRVEVADDPRLTGLAPRASAPHVPIIEPRPANSGSCGNAPVTDRLKF